MSTTEVLVQKPADARKFAGLAHDALIEIKTILTNADITFADPNDELRLDQALETMSELLERVWQG